MFAVDHFPGNVCNHGVGFTMCDAPYTWKGTTMDVPCTRCCGRCNDFYRSSWTTTRLVVLPLLCSIIAHANMYVLELGMYCLPRALESWWNILVKSGYARNLPFGDVALFMLATGTLMTMYQNDKDTISPHYLSVMTRFFGNN